MECHTYLRNVTDLLSGGKTPYERRFGQSFKGPTIPFGSLVEYHPLTAKAQSRIHQFGKKVLPGLFLGYALYAGGILKGDVLAADLEELETMDASEIYSKKTQCERGDISQRKRRIHFSNRRWTNQTSGRRSRPENIHLDTAATNSRRKSSHLFWSMSGNFIYRHHVEPRVKLYSPREESFPVPLKYIDVSRTTHTNLDLEQEKRNDDFWNIDGSSELSDPWKGSTRFILLEEKPPDGFLWSVRDQRENS